MRGTLRPPSRPNLAIEREGGDLKHHCEKPVPAKRDGLPGFHWITMILDRINPKSCSDLFQ